MITRLIVIIVLPLAIIGSWMFVSLRETIPAKTSGVSNPLLAARISIIRDPHGVPHIKAATDRDAFFAMGYVHAQDRLLQLELQRRMARGRMSEILGKGAVEDDVWFRTLGLYEATKSAWPALSDDAKQSLTAYAAGVNAWIAEKHSLPIELRILGISPEPWTESDSLAWIKIFALDLGGNYGREMSRFVANQALSSDQLLTFFPAYPADAPTTVARTFSGQKPDLSKLISLQARLERNLLFSGPYAGSNAWAVSGKHTTDGAALIANDPHLGLQIPSLWYVVSIDSPTLKVSGMSLVGLPLVIFGRNAHIAWAGTNMMADTQDLFLEQPEADGSRYRAANHWEAFETRTETIAVRADFPQRLRKQLAPIELKIRSTRHGPIISDYFGVFEQPVALRWTGLDAADTSYEAFFRLSYATDWQSFKAALQLHVAPAMNMLYADRHGNIGYLGIGRIPIRKSGEGTAPSPGWDENFGWAGYIPPEQWPQAFNPESGYVVSANNKVTSDQYPYFISHDWASPARARRIEAMLQDRLRTQHPLTIEDMTRMQADTLDLDAAAMAVELRKVPADTERDARAESYLQSWNGRMQESSQGAAIFNVWMRHFRKALFDDELRGYWNNPRASRLQRNLADGVRLEYLRDLVQQNDSPWCDNVTTPARETCADILKSSRESALWEIYKLKGDWSMKSWRWGELQSTVYAHIPFSHWKPLNKLSERRIANGGSQNSINVSTAEFAGADGYLQNFGAGFRQVIEMGSRGVTHLYMNSTGQSGTVMSPHYSDMVEPFQKVRYHVLLNEADANATGNVVSPMAGNVASSPGDAR